VTHVAWIHDRLAFVCDPPTASQRRDSHAPEPIRVRPGSSLPFAVGSLDDLHSAIWWVSARNTGDVYVGFRTSGGTDGSEVVKVSLHQSGRWRIAFTDQAQEFMTNPGDRVVQRFEPPPDITPGVKHALTIIVPMACLHRNPEPPLGNKTVSWWTALANDEAIRFDLLQQRPGSLDNEIADSHRLGVVGHGEFHDGSRIIVTAGAMKTAADKQLIWERQASSILAAKGRRSPGAFRQSFGARSLDGLPVIMDLGDPRSPSLFRGYPFANRR